jgi:hypothetical protein
MKFSQRIGQTSVKSIIQLKSMDSDLRSSLWNVFYVSYGQPIKESNITNIRNTKFYGFISTIWFSFFIKPVDDIPPYTENLIKYLRDLFFQWSWYEVYDFIEFVVKNPAPFGKNILNERFNIVLERELSGYRFIGDDLAPITDENQILEIQKALDVAQSKGLSGVYIHLKTSLEMLSDKKNRDYRNSIKESVSAVESISQLISGNSTAELGKALKVIRDSIGLHVALEQGFTKLYGYTSDGDGIRHALFEETNLDIEDAIYMLISCSAFINYLVSKSDKAGINLNK